MEKERTGILIQARTGSSRLPGKVVRPFYEGRNILEIIIDRLKEAGYGEQILVVTSTSENDEVICDIAEKEGVSCFRGSENNVLKRFVDGASEKGYSGIIRVCADNPFLQQAGIATLLEKGREGGDYCSFSMDNGKPTILNHIGVFAEFVRTDVLKKVLGLTSDSLYLEHVTNYVHGHPELFDVRLSPAPVVYQRTDIRLTCDTEEDFKLLQEIYAVTVNFTEDLQRLCDCIDEHPEWLKRMKKQIELHGK